MTMSSLSSPAMPALPQTAANEKTAKTAREFEGVFIGQMLSHMFEGVSTDPMFGGGPGEDMFRSMMVQKIGDQIANGPGIGMSDQIQKYMIGLQQQ